MTRQEHKDCFATMLPDGSGNEFRASSAAKVFAWESIPSGGLAAPERRFKVDIDEWDDCPSCEESDSCYRLCLARLSLSAAV